MPGREAWKAVRESKGPLVTALGRAWKATPIGAQASSPATICPRHRIDVVIFLTDLGNFSLSQTNSPRMCILALHVRTVTIAAQDFVRSFDHFRQDIEERSDTD
jgi:hypothetical protein